MGAAVLVRVEHGRVLRSHPGDVVVMADLLAGKLSAKLSRGLAPRLTPYRRTSIVCRRFVQAAGNASAGSDLIGVEVETCLVIRCFKGQRARALANRACRPLAPAGVPASCEGRPWSGAAPGARLAAERHARRSPCEVVSDRPVAGIEKAGEQRLVRVERIQGSFVSSHCRQVSVESSQTMMPGGLPASTKTCRPIRSPGTGTGSKGPGDTRKRSTWLNSAGRNELCRAASVRWRFGQSSLLSKPEGRSGHRRPICGPGSAHGVLALRVVIRSDRGRRHWHRGVLPPRAAARGSPSKWCRIVCSVALPGATAPTNPSALRRPHRSRMPARASSGYSRSYPAAFKSFWHLAGVNVSMAAPTVFSEVVDRSRCSPVEPCLRLGEGQFDRGWKPGE